MRSRAQRSPYLFPLIIGIAIVLFSTAGLARMMGWGANMKTDDPMAPVTMSGARARQGCPECGVIVAVREVANHDDDTGATSSVTAGSGKTTLMTTTGRHEITVRMADGSSRVSY